MSERAIFLLNTGLDEISQLTEEYPVYIPLARAASVLHIRPECLRASIEQGHCPFGFCWKLGDSRMAYKIPTITFVQWITQGGVLKVS